MKNNGFSGRIGYGFGRILRGYIQKEASAIDWLVERGAPRSLTKLILGVLKLGLLATLLCFALWIALPYLVLVVAGALHRRGLIFPERAGGDDGWRHGASGYGDYSGDHRVDTGRFDEDK
ncbi:hypothetical protein CI807_27405 [Pseudomonas sp. NS1(2017)]|uniref:DUF3742 family protein n=1 Tax=Pseudomonas sp. NS1(2017) TaxID=2025658 RepID=UPI000BA1FB23|nr:DUF3742 family protein [Pseudomonas sp. NS1(2017)]ASV39777.1 hypothetical protein CI807_27405 [Pseudomonas sp. NS1(2017)]